MNTLNRFYIAPLRYRPSIVTGEVVNIGLLFVFERLDNTIEICFESPQNLNRLKSIFPQTDTHNIKNYLSYFNNYAHKLTEELCHKISFLESTDIALKSIEHRFLVPESNSLFFDVWKSGNPQHLTQTAIIAMYIDDYFKSYTQKAIKKDTHDERYLITKIQSEVSEAYFNSNEKRHFGNNAVAIDFPLIWQNGTVNLIQPISFDLQHSNSIKKKALNWVGKLEQISAEISLNMRLDLLISKPQTDSLATAFDEAKAILSNLKLNKKIIEEADLPSYIKEINKTAHK